MHRFRLSALLCTTLLGALPASQAANQSAADEILALERMALDRWSKGDPGGFLSVYADEVTYFDPFQARRVDGKPALRAIYDRISGTFTIARYEIRNPVVQRSGDMAVLSYNLQNYMKQADGIERAASRWNSTSVFRRIDGKWRTVHSHWSFTTPELKAPPGQ